MGQGIKILLIVVKAPTYTLAQNIHRYSREEIEQEFDFMNAWNKYLPHPIFLELVLYDQRSTKIWLPDKK